MKVLIIEDEKEAYENLKSMLDKYDPTIIIMEWITSIEKAVDWFRTKPFPDLVFLDIYLSDGLSFEIFNHVEVKIPIIFTTAYHEYAIQAFETNSVDYLLKPFHQARLNQSIDKFKEHHHPLHSQLLENLKEIIGYNENGYESFKKRFLVKSGNKLYSVNTSEIAYFYRDELVFLITFDKAKFIIEYSLDELEKLLFPKEFFRLNRQVFVNINAIETTIAYSKGKLKVRVIPAFHADIIISQQRSSHFKKWLDDSVK